MSKYYYFIKPIIPRKLQIYFRKRGIIKKMIVYKNIWPIEKEACKKPNRWDGWPNQKKFSLLIRHDVETSYGYEKCSKLINIDKQLGYKSSFNFVPERYSVSDDIRSYLIQNGFEIGIHGLKHDGKLYFSKRLFQRRTIKINNYLKEWQSVGFYSPSSHNNLEWLSKLNIEYDSSTSDTDPFEPQLNNVNTIFPILIEETDSKEGFVEIPYTMPQDFTLFVLMQYKDIKIWKEKLDWIAEKKGMVFFNTHPDYMYFNNKRKKPWEYPVELYIEILKYIKTKYDGQYWHVLPKEMAHYWKNTYKDKINK